ncbi:LysR family transcriptional regulator [Paenibacillus arenilitoris]|uniref:LysR family transcriptional regulator n=1 Tax=Paenibacillus arenilitoris TaxID=2772299 RepID=A0A927CHX7_9BACL|nr:LysR family transcriptional regulator [Paenibacillus arenilitoris]MBD2867825.1 LysR family transcriptional regulator [Paenibacillus arenilitoris]
MEWQQLEYFQTVARMQHFTRAAEKLTISQPALSRSIANLEAELGVPLFDRQGRSIRLNRYGERFLKRADRALKEIQEGKEELAAYLDPDSGTVILSFLKSLGLSAVPNLLREFGRQAPHIRFELFQQSTRDMLDALEKGEADFALSSMTEFRGSVAWRRLWEEELYAYVPEGHPLASKPSIEIGELAEEPFIAVKKGYGLRTISDRLFEQAGIAPKITFEGEEVVTVLGFVSAGLGTSILPEMPDLVQSRAVRLRIAGAGSRRSIGLAWHKDGYLSPPAERFRSFLIARFKEETSSP